MALTTNSVDISVKLIPDNSNELNKYIRTVKSEMGKGVDMSGFTEVLKEAFDKAVVNLRKSKNITEQLINLQSARDARETLEEISTAAEKAGVQMEKLPAIDIKIGNKTINSINDMTSAINAYKRELISAEQEAEKANNVFGKAFTKNAMGEMNKLGTSLRTQSRKTTNLIKDILGSTENGNTDENKKALDDYLESFVRYESYKSGRKGKETIEKTDQFKKITNEAIKNASKFGITEEEVRNIISQNISKQNVKKVQEGLSTQIEQTLKGLNLNYEKIATESQKIFEIGREFDNQVKSLETQYTGILNIRRGLSKTLSSSDTENIEITEKRKQSLIDEAILLKEIESLYRESGVTNYTVPTMQTDSKSQLQEIIDQGKYIDTVEQRIADNLSKGVMNITESADPSKLIEAFNTINEIISDVQRKEYLISDGEEIIGPAYDEKGNEYNFTELLSKRNEIHNALISQKVELDEVQKQAVSTSEALNNVVRISNGTGLYFKSAENYVSNESTNNNSLGTVSGNGNYDSSEVDALKTKLTETQTEAEKLKTALDSANTELEKLKGLSSQSENDNNKITMLTAQVNELTQKLTSAEEKKKALESQIASSGSMNNSSGSVQLGEGEQVAKTSDLEAIKILSDSIKNLQDRMSKAEEILKEVPQGMDGLKKLSSQIEKMSGNFNEDGSIKNMGVSAEALSEQLKNLDAEFDARITKKIEELEKKSYKENQPKKKFKLAESVKSLKVVAEKATPKVEAQQVNIDIKSAQQDAAVKTEETTKELYKETEEYKTLSKAVQEYNALTSQKLDATAYDARIERLQKMQALVTSIIETVEKYEGKASELSALTLKSKNGNIGIQDTVRLDELMSKLKAGEAKNVSKKEEAAQLKQDAQKYVDVVRDYNNKFQSIISQKVSSGKQFNSMKQQLNDLANSIEAIMDKYNKLKGQDFYSADFAKYGNELWSKVKDASLDLNEITKYTKHEQEILNIQLKYSESLQRQKKEQDAVAEAARKKAEAEKEATKAAEETANKMSVAEKSREEQKRKALERQAAQSGSQTSNNNSIPTDNTTLSAILTEVTSINGKMDKPVKTEVANNTEVFTDGDRNNLEAYKKESKEDQITDLWIDYGKDSTQLTMAKINAFSGSLDELIAKIQNKLLSMQEDAASEILNPNSEYDDERAYSFIESITQLSGLLETLRNIGTNNNHKVLFNSTAIDNILAEVKAISQKMDTSLVKANNDTTPNISASQTPNNISSGVTAPAISDETQAASEASTAEVEAFKTIDGAVTGLTGDINTKTEAIRTEQQTMATAAESEVASISQIKTAIAELTTQIQNVPKVKIVGENDGKLNISVNLTEEQIAVIREKLKTAFSGEQAIPISFVPNVESLKQQISDALKNVPVEITNNNINKVIKVNKFKANSDGVEALRNSISSQLKNVKIQSFDATTAAESVKETLSKVLDGIGIKFDTEKLGNEVQEAVNAGVEAANAGQKPDTSENKAIRFKEKATSDIGKLRDKYTDKLQGQQLEVFKERLNEIDNKIKEIKDDASNYTDENAQVIEKDIKQIETLVNSFKEINNSEDKINSLIQKLKDSKNNIERRGAVAQPVVNNINSEMSALEELKRSGQNLNVGNPAEVQAFIDKLHEADATVGSLQQSAKDIRVSANATASVAKLDSKFNDLLFKVDKFKRDNSKITSDKGIAAQFDSLMRSIQTIEKSDVNFQRLNAQFNQLKATVQGKGLTGRSLGDELKYIAEKIGIKALLGNSIYRVIGAFRQMVGIVTELDTGMTTLRRVTEETEATYRKFLSTAGDEAHELGSTVSNLVSSTGDFARLGYNIQESSELAKNALMYSNVGWLDVETATADMTSTMKAFNIAAQDSVKIVDVFDILGNKYAVTAANIGEGLKESASALATANNSMEQSAAMITAITEITQDASGAGELRCPKMWKHIDESSYIG